MATLTASMVVDLQDRTGRKVQSIIGNLDRLKRAERNADLANQGVRLNAQQMAQERLMIEQARAAEERRGRMQAWIARGAAGVMAATYIAAGALKSFADVERQMTRIGITADASAEQVEAAFKTVQQQTKALAMPVEEGVKALDTLVASGQSLEEALAFLPSVLATAQATGAATEDIANTGLKAASALKIEAQDMQRAFDIMVAGGKAGQFELKDMAQYIPGLANSFATLGYEGADGLKRLIAVMQTLREDTGDASSAATQAQNIFGKIFAQDTANKFKDFGINLRKELEAAKAAGEDTLSAFIRLSNEAVKGDLSKLPLLFSDQEFRLGMQSLMTSPDALKKFFDVMNGANVDGTVLRDVGRVLSDTQSQIDKMAASWEQLVNSLGKTVAPAATAVMDTVSSDLDYGTAIRQALEKRKMSYLERETWMAMNLPLGGLWKTEEADKMAYEGGSREQELMERIAKADPNHAAAKEMEAKKRPPEPPEFPGKTTGAIPVPTPKPERVLPVGPDERGSKAASMMGLSPPAPPSSPPPPPSPEALIAIDDARRARQANMGGTTDTLPGKTADDFDVGRTTGPQEVTINGTPAVTLAGTPTVTISNPPPTPNVNVQMSVTINEAANPQAIAQQLGDAVRSEMNGLQASTNDSGL